jgi:hypothetical protein
MHIANDTSRTCSGSSERLITANGGWDKVLRAEALILNTVRQDSAVLFKLLVFE